MTSAYILILAILVLGGLLAVLGDRLGSKIGKKRMRLFNLRPRQTATVITIITGLLIAASTLGALFGLSKSLRQGVFELDEILRDRRAAIRDLEKQLNTARTEKEKVEKALLDAKNEQITIQKQLQSINRNFQKSRAQLKSVSGQLQGVKADITALSADRQNLLQQKETLLQQRQKLQIEVQSRDKDLNSKEQQLIAQGELLKQRQNRLYLLEKEQKDLQELITKRDGKIKDLDRAIASKDQDLMQKESQLKDLESQMGFLKREVAILEEYYRTYQELRERRIALVKGQVLAFGAFRIVDPQAVISVIDQLLTEANSLAIKATDPNNQDPQKRVVRITKVEVEQLIEQLQDGREYVVRILSAGNYVLGEQEVRVFADVALNQKVFAKDQEIAAVSVDTEVMSDEDIQKRLDLLLSAAQFRARSAGVLGPIYFGDGRLTQLIDFIAKIEQSSSPIDEIKVVASDSAYTAGPLKLRLVALKDGEAIFSS